MDHSHDSAEARLKVDPTAALQAELAAVKSQEANNSWLRQGIDCLTEPFHHQSSALSHLEATAKQINHRPNSTQTQAAASRAIQQMESARQSESDAYSIASSVAKTAATFAPGKLGLLTAGSLYALDAIGGSGTTTSDALWGFGKGVLMRSAVGSIAQGNANPAIMSLKLGASSRIIDTALTPSNFINSKDGEVSWHSFGKGLVTIGQNTLNPTSLAADAATAGLAHGLVKLAPGALTGNTFRTMTTTTFSRGYANGIAEELQNEYHKGQYSAQRLALYPLATGLATALGAAPGNQSMRVRNWPLENAATIRELDYRLVALNSSDIKAITRGGGKAVETTVKAVGEDLVLGSPENLFVSRANIPTDWIAAAFKGRMQKTSPAQEEWRFLSRPKDDPSAPWQMATNRGTTPVSDLIRKSSENYYQGRQTGPVLSRLTEPATRFLGSGSESGAFQLANGAVLKVSSLNSPEKSLDWGQLPYDSRAMFSPLLFAKVPNPYNRQIVSTAASILLQEPLRTPVSEAQAANLRDNMAKKNVNFWDYNFHLQGEQASSAVEQAGIDARGNVVMLDYGARRAAYNEYKQTKSLEMPEQSRPNP